MKKLLANIVIVVLFIPATIAFTFAYLIDRVRTYNFRDLFLGLLLIAVAVLFWWWFLTSGLTYLASLYGKV